MRVRVVCRVLSGSEHVLTPDVRCGFPVVPVVVFPCSPGGRMLVLCDVTVGQYGSVARYTAVCRLAAHERVDRDGASRGAAATEGPKL